MFKSRKPTNINAQIKYEKVANSYFESTNEILHQCKKLSNLKNGKTEQRRKETRAYIPDSGTIPPKEKQPMGRKQSKQVGGQVAASNGEQAKQQLNSKRKKIIKLKISKYL